jgi:hypothetical protein
MRVIDKKGVVHLDEEGLMGLDDEEESDEQGRQVRLCPIFFCLTQSCLPLPYSGTGLRQILLNSLDEGTRSVGMQTQYDHPRRGLELVFEN